MVYVYLHLPSKIKQHLGKYTSPMNFMGYIYTPKRSQLCPIMRFSTLDFQDFCDFCERYQNYEREVSGNFFWWMAFFPIRFVGFFPWDLVDGGCLALFHIVFFITKKRSKGEDEGVEHFFKKWVRGSLDFKYTNKSFKKFFTGRLGIGSSWMLPSPHLS